MPALGLLLSMTMGLTGCVSAPPRPADAGSESAALEERARRLAGYPVWSATGRIAVDDGQDGGSGQFRWRRDRQGFELLVRAPLGQGSWRLHQQTGGPAVLEASHLEAPVSGPDASVLVSTQIGWHVPVQAMTWWARALQAPGGDARVSLNADRLPATLVQQDWRVEFEDYATVGALTMPRKLNATRPPYSVRVVVATWRLEPEGASP